MDAGAPAPVGGVSHLLVPGWSPDVGVMVGTALGGRDAAQRGRLGLCRQAVPCPASLPADAAGSAVSPDLQLSPSTRVGSADAGCSLHPAQRRRAKRVLSSTRRGLKENAVWLKNLGAEDPTLCAVPLPLRPRERAWRRQDCGAAWSPKQRIFPAFPPLLLGPDNEVWWHLPSCCTSGLRAGPSLPPSGWTRLGRGPQPGWEFGP